MEKAGLKYFTENDIVFLPCLGTGEMKIPVSKSCFLWSTTNGFIFFSSIFVGV